MSEESVLDTWMDQVQEWLESDKFTPAQKRRLLTFNAGACWGYAIATDDSAERLKGFRFREEISQLVSGIGDETS